MKRMPGFASFILFAALCASAAFWFLQLWRPPVRPVAAPVAAVVVEVPMEAAASLFGGRPIAVGVASNYQLRGVVVAQNGRESVAILSADGKPPQAVGVNTEFQPGVIVREVHPQYVLLSESGVIKRVALPDSARAGGTDITMPGLQKMPQPQVMPQLPPSPPQSMTTPQLPIEPPAAAIQAMQPVPQFQSAPQGAAQVVQPVIGQMSNQLSTPGQPNAAGQPVVPLGQPVNPASMPPTIPTPSAGGGMRQQRRQ